MHHIGKVFPLCVAAMLSSYAIPQSKSTMGPLESPMNQKQLQTIVKKYARVSNSLTSMERIPSNVVYKAIFVEILSNPPFPADFTESDITIISSLPSHNSSQFREVEAGQLAATCAQMSKGNADTNEYATRYEDIHKQANEMLNGHYERVLSSLSPAAIDHVERRYVQMSGTPQIGYAEVDYSQMSMELPEVTQQLLDRGCENLKAIEQMDIPFPETLSEELSTRSMRAMGLDPNHKSVGE